jgi:predicted nucleic acid-binding protein
MAWAEYLCGPLAAGERTSAALIVGTPEPVTEAHAARAAELVNASGPRRGSLADSLIAAVALGAGAAIATENHADFPPFASTRLRSVPQTRLLKPARTSSSRLPLTAR